MTINSFVLAVATITSIMEANFIVIKVLANINGLEIKEFVKMIAKYIENIIPQNVLITVIYI